MTQSKDELCAALADVRRAYRLLWAFQKRILDYNRIIRERFKFSHWAAESAFKMSAANPETKWVWGMLPMADVGFRASRHCEDTQYENGNWSAYPKANDAVLCVWVRADTGIPEAAPTDPSPLTFRAVEDCQTKLSLYLVLNREERKVPINLWIASSHCFKIMAGRGMTVHHPTVPGIDIFGMDFDLAELPDEDALLKGIEAFGAAVHGALGVRIDELSQVAN